MGAAGALTLASAFFTAFFAGAFLAAGVLAGARSAATVAPAVTAATGAPAALLATRRTGFLGVLSEFSSIVLMLNYFRERYALVRAPGEQSLGYCTYVLLSHY